MEEVDLIDSWMTTLNITLRSIIIFSITFILKYDNNTGHLYYLTVLNTSTVSLKLWQTAYYHSVWQPYNKYHTSRLQHKKILLV